MKAITRDICGCLVHRSGLIVFCCEEHDPEVLIEKLKEMLAAAASRCRFAARGMCDLACNAREYCRALGLPLKEVEDAQT